jgi:tRNA G18 (ribose-2'-O)-methylase SpoU
MTVTTEISDPADPRLADYLALTDAGLRSRTDPANGIFIAEGELVVRRAVTAGYALRSMLLLPKLAGSLGPLAGPGVPVYVADAALLRAVTGFHVHRGVLASVVRPAPPDPAGLLATARRLAVLESVNNATNLGAVVRSAAGLGMDGLLLDQQSTDPLFRRAVRVSMGEVFALPWARLGAWPEGLDALAEAGFTVLALTPGPDAEPLDRVDVSGIERVAVLLGAEGPGLSEQALARAHRQVRIPMAAGVDSLNVAAAAAVVFWALGRRTG